MRQEHRREWLPAILCFGSPCLTAAITVAGTVLVMELLPRRSPWLIVALTAIPLANLVLAVIGSAAGGLLTRGSLSERGWLAITYGFGGLFMHGVAIAVTAIVLSNG